MSVKVLLPTAYRRLAGNQASLEVQAPTVGSLLAELRSQYPELGQQICDERGQRPRYLNVYVNNQEIEDLAGEGTPLRAGDEVALVPAMAGGATAFSPDEVVRYSRHIIMGEVGGVGQRKLNQAKVLMIGAGGLGSPAAIYLAAAGVGTIGIVDFDVVDLSNLQRQILHHTNDVGRLKVDSTEDGIRDINPHVKVIKHNFALRSENALDVIKDYDIVVNGSDNFPTRYLVNDACVLLKKPLVDGGMFRFEGQATVFVPGQGCYRCLYPTPPPAGAVPSCAEAGVFGVLPGIIGCIEAIETIKLILGIGESLAGRLLLFDALGMDFRQVRIRRDANCPICGDNPTITELIDYDEFCGVVPAVIPAG